MDLRRFKVVGMIMAQRCYAYRTRTGEIHWTPDEAQAGKFNKTEVDGIKHWYPCFVEAIGLRKSAA